MTFVDVIFGSAKLGHGCFFFQDFQNHLCWPSISAGTRTSLSLSAKDAHTQILVKYSHNSDGTEMPKTCSYSTRDLCCVPFSISLPLFPATSPLSLTNHQEKMPLWKVWFLEKVKFCQCRTENIMLRLFSAHWAIKLVAYSSKRKARERYTSTSQCMQWNPISPHF